MVFPFLFCFCLRLCLNEAVHTAKALAHSASAFAVTEGSELVEILVTKLVLFTLVFGGCFFTGDNDAAGHSAVVFLFLLIDNYLLCFFGSVDVYLDSRENALIINGKKLVKRVGVNEFLYRAAEADVDVVALMVGNDALSEGLMCNFSVLKNHYQYPST